MTTSAQSRLGTAPEEGIKAPCTVAASSNITLSGAQTINSIPVAAGDRVLVIGQTDTTENGIYDVKTSTWTRSTDFNASNDVVTGQLVTVPNAIYKAVFTGLFQPGTTELTFSSVISSLPNNYQEYEFTTDIAANSHVSISTGHSISTDYYDSNRRLGSGEQWAYTGTTTGARAGDGLYTDGYVYDADGKQFQNKTANTLAQLTALTPYHGQLLSTSTATYEYNATSTATADGVTIVTMDSGVGRLLLKHDGNLSIELFGASTSNTAAANTIAIQAGLDSGVGKLYVPGPDLKVFNTNELDISSSIDFTIDGTLRAGTSSTAFNLLEVTARDVTISGGGCIDLNDTDDTYSGGFIADRIGLYVHGVDNASFISNFKFDGPKIKNCGQSGMFLQYVEDAEIHRPNIQRCGQHGIRGFSVRRCYVYKPYIDDIYPGNSGTAPYLNAYGITFSREGSDDVPVDCGVYDGEVRNVTSWEAYDTHYGKRIEFVNCSSYYCSQGVVVQSTTAGAESQDIQISGGKHHAFPQAYSRSTQAYEPGSAVVCNMGSSSTNGTGLVVEGVQARGHGSGRNSSNGAITINNAEDVEMSGNLLIDSLKRGIAVLGGTENVHLGPNTIAGVTAVDSLSRGIEVPADFSGYVSSAQLITGVANQDIHPSELVVSGGTVTATMDFHTIDTEAGAASDDLDTINGGWVGRTIRFSLEASARVVTTKHGTGNIRCAGSADLVPNDENDMIIATCNENGVWVAQMVSV